MIQHGWYFSERSNLSIGASVWRCSHCGCWKIHHGMPGILPNVSPYDPTATFVYKPADFTWNPFKKLHTEPPCPATW